MTMAKDTVPRILRAARDLMSERGYEHVTVKEIAQVAGVSEMTVFRKFDTKIGILKALIAEYSYMPYFEHFFDTQLSGDLAQDLTDIAENYLYFMTKNQAIFLISIQERGHLPELQDEVSQQHTQKLVRLLTNYFAKQQAQGNIRLQAADVLAHQFLTTLFGFFVSTTLWDTRPTSSFVASYIDTFVQGIRV